MKFFSLQSNSHFIHNSQLYEALSSVVKNYKCLYDLKNIENISKASGLLFCNSCSLETNTPQNQKMPFFLYNDYKIH